MGINYFNGEHYADPTAYEACRRIDRAEKKKKPPRPQKSKGYHTRVWRSSGKEKHR